MAARLANVVAVLGIAALSCAACERAQASTYRWGGRGAHAAYLVDMATVKRTGPRVEFETVFLPSDPKKPELSDMYVRARQWIDCARALQFESGQQVFSSRGVRVPTPSDADAHPTPIAPGTTWASVRDLVCTGSNDLNAAMLSGTDVQVVAQARAYMAAHPIAG